MEPHPQSRILSRTIARAHPWIHSRACTQLLTFLFVTAVVVSVLGAGGPAVEEWPAMKLVAVAVGLTILLKVRAEHVAPFAILPGS